MIYVEGIPCLVDYFCVVTRISDIKLKEGKVLFGSMFQKFHSMEGQRRALKWTLNLRECRGTRIPSAIRQLQDLLSVPCLLQVGLTTQFPQPSKLKPPGGDKAFETYTSEDHFRHRLNTRLHCKSLSQKVRVKRKRCEVKLQAPCLVDLEGKHK